MIQTISWRDMVEYIGGAFILGIAVGFMLAAWLVTFAEKRKDKHP